MIRIRTSATPPRKPCRNWDPESPMALTLPCDTSRIVSLDDYVGHIKSRVNFQDVESIQTSAPMLRALANDRTLVLNQLNQAVENNFKGIYLRSAQAFVLARTEEFVVRAAIWPPSASVATGRVYQEQFSYDLAHDHNFSFMTVNYLGPGYDTDIYEYDYEKVIGYVGEPVDIRFLEKKRFGPGSVMLYRGSKDLHIQHPPPELTITLNLMWAPADVRIHEQFIFDVDRKIISGYAGDGDANKRISLLTMAGYLGDSNTQELLADLARRHPCRRSRLAAYEALVRLTPSQASAIWERACGDPAPLVEREAREKLAKLAA